MTSTVSKEGRKMMRKYRPGVAQKRREAAIRRSIIVVMGAIVIILSLIFIGRMTALDHSFAREVSRQKYYKSVPIEEGDTLWKIAAENMSEEYSSVDSYIEDLRQANDLTSDQISTGQYLTVPYYASVTNVR